MSVGPESPDDPAVLLGMRVVAFLRAERERQKLSQNELSQRCNISRTGLRAIEVGVNSPTLVSLLRISKGLGVSLSEILAGAERDSQPTPENPEQETGQAG